MIGRLLKRLEKRIESRRREHVHLVDQVDLIRTPCRRISGILAQGSDALDAVIAGAIDLHDIETTSFGDLDAGIADATGIVGGTVFIGLTVQCFRKNAC